MDLLQVSSDGYCWKLWEMETNSQKEFCFSLVHVWMTDILGCAVLQDQTQARKAFHYLSLVPWEKTKLHANWLSCKGKIARVKQSKMATLEIKDDLAFNSATHEDASDFRCVSSFCLPLSSLLKTCLHKLTYFPTYTSPYMCGICAAAWLLLVIPSAQETVSFPLARQVILTWQCPNQEAEKSLASFRIASSCVQDRQQFEIAIEKYDKILDPMAGHARCFSTLSVYAAGMICFACDTHWRNKVHMAEGEKLLRILIPEAPYGQINEWYGSLA